MPHLATIADHVDELLRTTETPDYPGAHNGVQLANRGTIHHIAAAVDFSRRVIDAAVRLGANLLLVHHGMFWGGAQRLVGPSYERLRLLIEHDVAVYSSHLPLDAHPELGNNAQLARQLDLEPTEGFARFQTIDVGVRGYSDVETTVLVQRAATFAAEHASRVRVTGYAEGRVTRHWAICTGAGASAETLHEAERLGIDTLVVGEGPHYTAVAAEEAGLVIIYAGHYATETLGVRALAEHVSKMFNIPWSFIEAPTGL